jgi:hypothetical protein
MSKHHLFIEILGKSARIVTQCRIAGKACRLVWRKPTLAQTELDDCGVR